MRNFVGEKPQVSKSSAQAKAETAVAVARLMGQILWRRAGYAIRLIGAGVRAL